MKAYVYLNEIKGAHIRIGTCYRVLNDELSPVIAAYVERLNKSREVYTNKLSQGENND